MQQQLQQQEPQERAGLQLIELGLELVMGQQQLLEPQRPQLLANPASTRQSLL